MTKQITIQFIKPVLLIDQDFTLQSWHKKNNLLCAQSAMTRKITFKTDKSLPDKNAQQARGN